MTNDELDAPLTFVLYYILATAVHTDVHSTLCFVRVVDMSTVIQRQVLYSYTIISIKLQCHEIIIQRTKIHLRCSGPSPKICQQISIAVKRMRSRKLFIRLLSAFSLFCLFILGSMHFYFNKMAVNNLCFE